MFVKSSFVSNEPTRTGGARSRAAKQTRHGPESHLGVNGVLSIPRTQNPHHRLIGRRFDFWVEVLIAFVLPQARQERLTNINNPFSALHIIATLCPPARSPTHTSTPTRPLPPGHHPHRFDEGLDIVYRNNNPRQPSRWENHGQSLARLCAHSPSIADTGHHRQTANSHPPRRQELVQWLNSLLQLNVTKVEQCGTG